MRQSLFRKYFSMCCSITLAGIVVLGVVFMVFAAQYFQEDKLGALEKNAEYAAQMSEKYIVSVDGQYQLANNTMLTVTAFFRQEAKRGKYGEAGAFSHPPPPGVENGKGYFMGLAKSV